MGRTVYAAAASDSNNASISSRIRRALPCFFGSSNNEMTTNPRSVLFICLGNICRSPIAEAVFRHVCKERGVLDNWIIDSAATADYHVGEPPDNRAEACLRRHGVTSSHIVRQRIPSTAGWTPIREALTFKAEDFQNYAYILAMDHENIKNIKRRAPKNMTARVELLGQYDSQHELIIEDPYYGTDADFDTVYEQCLRSCRMFLDHVEKDLVKSSGRRY